MRAVKTSSSGDTSEDTDDQSDVLEMHPRNKQKDAVPGTLGTENLHTEEYWKANNANNRTSNADWIRDEESLNRGHRASVSFAVLNELVVVHRPLYTLMLMVGSRTQSVFKYVGIIW